MENSLRKQILAVILVFLSSLFVFGQETERILDKEMDISFGVPEGWKATKEGDYYLLGSPGTSGFMMIKTELLHSMNEVKAAMETGIKTKDGSVMKPAEELRQLGDQGVAGLYHGNIDDVEMTGYLMALMNAAKQKTVLVISVSPSASFNQSNLDNVKILLRSVIFE